MESLQLGKSSKEIVDCPASHVLGMCNVSRKTLETWKIIQELVFFFRTCPVLQTIVLVLKYRQNRGNRLNGKKDGSESKLDILGLRWVIYPKSGV